MSEEALAEKEAAVAGEGSAAQAASARSIGPHASGHSVVTSGRSLACAAHRVSTDGPPTSRRSIAGATNRTSLDAGGLHAANSSSSETDSFEKARARCP